METIKFLYRYEYILIGYDEEYCKPIVRLQCRSYPVIKTTKCGVWIKRRDKKKFVNMKARKKFANATPQEALEAFYHRKVRQKAIMLSQLDSINCAIMLAKYEMENMK